MLPAFVAQNVLFEKFQLDYNFANITKGHNLTFNKFTGKTIDLIVRLCNVQLGRDYSNSLQFM